MTSFYEDWWTELEPTFAAATPIVIGHPAAPQVTMTAHDWITDAMPPWNQAAIRAGGRKRGKAAAPFDGFWQIDVAAAGPYEFELRRWPAEADQPITAAIAAGENVPGSDQAFRTTPGVSLPTRMATLRVDDQVVGETDSQKLRRFRGDIDGESHGGPASTVAVFHHVGRSSRCLLLHRHRGYRQPCGYRTRKSNQ